MKQTDMMDVMKAGFSELTGDIRAMRTQMNDRFHEIKNRQERIIFELQREVAVLNAENNYLRGEVDTMEKERPNFDREKFVPRGPRHVNENPNLMARDPMYRP